MHSERFVNDRLMREQAIKNTEVLNKVKELEFLPKTEMLTLKMVANYYNVHEDAIESVIRRNKDELDSDGMRYIEGQELRNLKTIIKNLTARHVDGQLYRNICEVQNDGLLNEQYIKPKARKVAVFTKRAILRIGMLLRDSEIAKQIRTYLLNVYELTPVEIKDLAWHVEREISIRERTVLTEAIKKCIPESPNKKWAYKNYTDLCYKIVFGKTAKQIYEEKGLESKSDNLRDNLNRDELNAIEKIERAIAVFLEISYSYDEIKDILFKKKDAYKMNYAA